MSEKLLKLFLDELKTIRLICAKGDCRGVIEVQCNQIVKHEFKCPVCGGDFNYVIPTKGDPLQKLVESMACVAMQSDRYHVQFVLPDNGAEKPSYGA